MSFLINNQSTKNVLLKTKLNNTFFYTKYLLFILFLGIISCQSNSSKNEAPKDPYRDSLRQKALQNIADDPIGFFSAKKDSTANDSLPPNELALLQEGDILMRKGYGNISDFIADFLNEKYRVTHCGFIVLEGYHEAHILHTVSNDSVEHLFVEPLRDYIQQSQLNSLVAVRLNGTNQQRKAVVKEAKRLLKKKIPFDMAFNDKDTTEMYCAEMMSYVFKQVYQEDLMPRRAVYNPIDVLHMDNFFEPKYFEVLFNHFEQPVR
ncbi:MAG: hypothetical protein MK212_15355 [Saprospiraceae bacterium]|nr:hypothetical protein [Saprospiraceae bacterium]